MMVVAMAMSGVVLAIAGTAPVVHAQRGLAARIEAVRSGRVRMTFAARDGVCGNGMSWFRTRGGAISGTIINGTWSGGRDVEATCERGPVRLVVVRRDGETTELRKQAVTYLSRTKDPRALQLLTEIIDR